MFLSTVLRLAPVKWLSACRGFGSRAGGHKQQEMGWGDGSGDVCVCVCVNSAGGLGRASCYTWKRTRGFCPGSSVPVWGPGPGRRWPSRCRMTGQTGQGCGTPDLHALAWGVVGEGGAGSGGQAPARQPRAPAREAALGLGFSRVCECVRRTWGRRRGKLHWNLSLFSPEILNLRRARDEGVCDPSTSHSKAVTPGPIGSPVHRL